jgi:hypothetical protein
MRNEVIDPSFGRLVAAAATAAPAALGGRRVRVNLVELPVEERDLRPAGRSDSAVPLHHLRVRRPIRIGRPRLQVGHEVPAPALIRVRARHEVPGVLQPLVNELVFRAVAAGVHPAPDVGLSRLRDDVVAGTFDLVTTVGAAAERRRVRPLTEVASRVRGNLVPVLHCGAQTRP